MSKAFTKEDDGDGFAFDRQRQSSSARVLGPVSAQGAKLARERLLDVIARLERATRAEERVALEAERSRLARVVAARVAPPPNDPDVVAFGSTVRVRDSADRERVVVVASVDEIGLVPHAASPSSPLANALLGARAGDTVEVGSPKGIDELTVVEVWSPS